MIQEVISKTICIVKASNISIQQFSGFQFIILLNLLVWKAITTVSLRFTNHVQKLGIRLQGV